MEIFLIVLFLLALIALSNMINRLVFFIPVPLIQIALGMIVAGIPFGFDIPLSPELFFVLFVAPLLFNDGKRVPRDELWNMRAPILLLALGLVFATMLVGGHVIHWMIPSIPMPAAYALAAILSPTDAVSVSAISGRIKLPKDIMRLLEGEALMNDASGLVAFKFAIAAMVTGSFSLAEATVSFVLISVGGLICGAAAAFLIIWFRVFLRRFGIEDITMHMLIQILTPFAIFLIAEELHLSGVLAVVAGGIVHAIERDRSESLTMKLQFVSAGTWSVILFILNGLVFVILGLQIPSVLAAIFENNAFNNGQVLSYIVVISLTLIVLRFLWVYLFSALERNKEKKSPRFKSAVLTSLSGVRGAITLAGAFSIPLYLDDGSLFPERSLIIFLSAGVILFTLIVASFILPLIPMEKSPKLEGQKSQEDRLKHAKIQIMNAAVRAIKDHIQEDNKAAALTVIADYRRQLLHIRTEGASTKEGADFRKMTKKLHLLALDAERQAVEKLFERGEISPTAVRRIQFQLKQTELLLTNRLKYAAVLTILVLRKVIRKLMGSKKEEMSEKDIKVLREIKKQAAEAAAAAIEKIMDNSNKSAALTVVSHYHEMIERLNSGMQGRKKSHKADLDVKGIHIMAIQTERDEIQSLYEKGEITYGMANKLRLFSNFREASAFEEEEIG
ncbi:Na+/H+ antiporter [Paenibacillus nasutitermitis]|uniref:Sodium, potassium, lithium and rubidium/H(+) antiporter n=1 Tax=Paenibacillus nasutitermitis TaxID=1652958 RepID=A0A917DNA6_9BACL|nr:Na+/H+ antiporter [Paenibacillus nasutitermitis]GGD51121.1 sodium, potassium, lithium and rubidium/H(+) antiporter [Paenibacillus nasutitermitis]